MWLGLITSNGLGDEQKHKDLLGPFKTSKEANKAVADKIQFAGERGFIFEGEEVMPDIVPCPDCGGHVGHLITECEGNEVHIKGYRLCETCKGAGKVLRTKPCSECGGDCINKSVYRKKKK